jgi:hypothetical protein
VANFQIRNANYGSSPVSNFRHIATLNQFQKWLDFKGKITMTKNTILNIGQDQLAQAAKVGNVDSAADVLLTRSAPFSA